LRAVATAIREEGVLAYRLGGDEFVLEGEDPVSIQDAVDRIRERLGAAAIEAARPDGSARRLTGARIHAGLGGSLDEADAALNSAKRAGVAAGERAARGDRPRGLSEVGVSSLSKRKEPPGSGAPRAVLRHPEDDLSVRAAVLVHVQGAPHLPEGEYPGDMGPDQPPLDESHDPSQIVGVVPHAELD